MAGLHPYSPGPASGSAAVAALRKRLGPPLSFGEPVVDEADPGLFGPGSATWAVNGDATAVIGGIRALLLQALHPTAMATVDRLSDYRRNTWGRLLRTAEYIGMTCFGTTTEAESTAQHVRTVHERLGITDEGELLWVHAALVDSVLDAYLRTHPDSEASFADRYIDEQRSAAALVDIDAARVFATTSELAGYMKEIRPRLHMTRPAIAAADALFDPHMPWYVRWLTPAVPAWRFIMTTSFMCLPSWVQADYEAHARTHSSRVMRACIRRAMRGSEAERSRRADARIRRLRALLMASPSFVRIGPHVTAAYTRLGLRAADHH